MSGWDEYERVADEVDRTTTQALGVKPQLKPKVDPSLPHGSYSTYTNHRCRCTECRAANVVANRKFREKRRKKFLAGEVTRPHGLLTTYTNYGCRCARCTAANSLAASRARGARRR